MNSPRARLAVIAAAAALVASLPAFAQGAPTCVQGASGVAPGATITFTAPTTNTDGTPVATPLTYEVLQGTSATSLAVVAKGVAGSPVTVDTGLTPGTTVYFAVVAVDAHGNASPQSNVACKIFPASIPSAVVITLR